jgi:hypothetical protein
MRFLLLMLLALVIVAAIIVLFVRSQPERRVNSVIHVPASGRCPEDYERQPKFFTERDGSTKDACVSQTVGDGSIDVVMPGESFHLTVPVPLPPNAAGSERRKL